MGEPVIDNPPPGTLAVRNTELSTSRKLSPHQLEIRSDLEQDVVLASLMQALISKSRASSPYLDHWKSYTDISFAQLNAICERTQQVDTRVLAQLENDFGRTIHVKLMEDGTNIIGIYDSSTGRPIPAELAAKVFLGAGDRYEILLDEKEFEDLKSKEPLDKQLSILIERVGEVFGSTPADIQTWPKTESNLHVVPSVNEIVEQMRKVTGWVKVESPKHPNSIRSELPNGDYVIAKVLDNGELSSLIWTYTTGNGNPTIPSGNTLSYLNASFNPPDMPSFMKFETYNGWSLAFQTSLMQP